MMSKSRTESRGAEPGRSEKGRQAVVDDIKSRAIRLLSLPPFVPGAVAGFGRRPPARLFIAGAVAQPMAIRLVIGFTNSMPTIGPPRSPYIPKAIRTGRSH